jgi:hypothetical protein
VSGGGGSKLIFNPTGHVLYNVTWRRVRATIVVVENNTYYIF